MDRNRKKTIKTTKKIALVLNPESTVHAGRPDLAARLHKSARRTGPCLRFLGIKASNPPQHPMFREDTTGLPVELIRKELQENAIKRKAKPTEK